MRGGSLKQGLSNAVRNSAVNLTQHCSFVDDRTKIIDRSIIDDFNISRLSIYLHFTGMTSVGVASVVKFSK